MKKAFYFSFTLLLVAVSCKKPADFYQELGQGSVLTLVKQNNALLNAADQTSTVSQVVSFNGQPVESVNLYVSATASIDKTKWKLIKNIPFSGETTLSATNKEIATALGLTPGALVPGSVFHLYNEAVLKDGSKFSSINTSAIDLENQAPFNVAFHWTATVVCPYDPTKLAGTYTVVQDDWVDWHPGDKVEVRLGANNNTVDISQVWPGSCCGVPTSTPLTFTVDKDGIATFTTGVVWGDYGPGAANKTTTLAGSSGFVFSCTNTISLIVHFSYGAADQGFLRLILQK